MERTVPPANEPPTTGAPTGAVNVPVEFQTITTLWLLLFGVNDKLIWDELNGVKEKSLDLKQEKDWQWIIEEIKKMESKLWMRMSTYFVKIVNIVIT